MGTDKEVKSVVETVKEQEVLKILERHLFEIAEDSIKISQTSQGSLLQEEILMDTVGCNEVSKEATALLKEFNRLSILGKAYDYTAKLEDKRLTEEETRTNLISPIIKILWSFSDEPFTREEWRCIENETLDYLIRNKGKNTNVAIEAKRYSNNLFVLKKNLVNSSYKGQVAKYVSATSDVDGFSMVILINGRQLAVFLQCHIDGDYQPARFFTRPVFMMGYNDATYNKCVILAYLVKYALHDHSRITNKIEKIFNRKMSTLRKLVKEMEDIEYGK